MCQASGVTYSTVANPPDVPNGARTHGWDGWLPYRPGRHPSVSSRGAFLRAAPGQRAPPPACPARPGCSGARGGAGCSRPRQETEAEGHRHQHRHLRRRPERTHARAPRLLYALRRPARATPRPPESRPRSSALQWAFPVLAPRRPGLVPGALPRASPARRPELSPSVRVRTVRRGRAPRSPGSSSGRGETLQNGDPSGTYLPVSGRAA